MTDRLPNRFQNIPRCIRAVGIAAFGLLLAAPGHSAELAGQRLPVSVLTANSGDFDIADDVTALHYYGVGGWGIQWRGAYLLLAPYFSNHGALQFLRKREPDLDAISAGVANTPFADAGLIVVGHGHVDHAADIPGYAAAGLPSAQAGLIANRTTQNLLADLLPPEGFLRCAEAPETDGDTLTGCTLPGFRITALRSAHAPNVELLGGGFTVATGTLDQPRQSLPERPSDYLAGDTWAYLIDLVDDANNVVFRIHYMDAVAGSADSGIPASLIAERAVDIHIACVPGFNYVDDYPEWAIEQGKAGYVLMGHWEDFLRPRDKPLKPVTFVLNAEKLDEFAQRVSDAVSPREDAAGPVNKSVQDCPENGAACGPSGDHWALPIPGETYHFRP